MPKINFKKALHGLKSKLDKLRQKIHLTEKQTEQIEVVRQPLPGAKAKETLQIEVSALTVLKVMVVVIVSVIMVNFLANIVDIILVLFAAAVLAAAIMPIVNYFELKRIPRALTTLLIYILVIAFLVLLVYSFIPFFAEQLGGIANYLNNLIQYLSQAEIKDLPFADRLEPLLTQIDQRELINQLQKFLQTVSAQLQGLAAGAFNVATGIFSGLFATLTILVLAFYMVLEKKALEGFFRSLLPRSHELWFIRHVATIQAKMGSWVRGQIALSLIIGILIYIGLKILGVQYAATLAILAGIFEIIPYIGPIFSGIFAAIIAFIQSPLLALFVIIMFMIVQVLENNVVVPLVMRRAVGLNPIVIIAALLIGGKLMGVLGMIISVPVATALSVFINDYLGRER